MNHPLNIGIILGSTREGRVSPEVGHWVLTQAKNRNDANYEIIDIRDYHLPLLGEAKNDEGIAAWKNKIGAMDGFIFVTQEYNHSLAASLKNAIDHAREAWHNKAAGIVSYGSAGGARAAEHLRCILGELKIADVRTHVVLSLFTDFDADKHFKPQEVHLKKLDQLCDEVETWSKALRIIRA